MYKYKKGNHNRNHSVSLLLECVRSIAMESGEGSKVFSMKELLEEMGKIRSDSLPTDTEVDQTMRDLCARNDYGMFVENRIIHFITPYSPTLFRKFV